MQSATSLMVRYAFDENATFYDASRLLPTVEEVERKEAKKLQRTNFRQIAEDARQKSRQPSSSERRFKYEPAPFPARASDGGDLLTLRFLSEQIAENDKQAVRKRQLIQENLNKLSKLESDAERLGHDKQTSYGADLFTRPDYNKIRDRFYIATDAVREHYTNSTVQTNAAEAAFTEYQVSLDELCRRIDRDREKTATDAAAAAELESRRLLEQEAAAAESRRIAEQQKILEVAAAKKQNSLDDVGVRRELYEYCLSLVNDTQAQVAEIATNPLNRSIKNAYYLFINTTVNTMSSRASSEVQNSIQKILRFFAGGAVQTVGGKMIDLSLHRFARVFCLQQLCQRVLKQIASKGEVQQSAASIMSLAIFSAEVWSALPEFGTMLMAHMLVELPILIPYPPPRTDAKQDAVVTGMVVGYAKFFAALVSAGVTRRPASGFFGAQLPHPTQSLTAGTVFMLILRLTKDGTGSSVALKVLYALITFAGEIMLRTYGDKQFSKLITLVCDDFVTDLEQSVPAATWADVKPDCLRLKLFKEHFYTKRQVMPLEDGLTREFYSL